MRLFRRKKNKRELLTQDYLLRRSRFKETFHHSGTNRFGDYTTYYLYKKNRGLSFPISIRFYYNKIEFYGNGSGMFEVKEMTIENFEKLMDVFKK